ncbi:MAG TPA: hypothetical protein DCF91_04760 [Porphyromonadaceae bacterium]|nr:hypothetical protein [Porphyromonadaceae bacterium]
MDMRKVIFTIAGTLFIGLPALFAQKATTTSSYSTQELQTLLVQLRDSTQKDKYLFAKELAPLEKFATTSVSANIAEKALANYSLAYLYATYYSSSAMGMMPFNNAPNGNAPLLTLTQEQLKQKIDWAIQASLKNEVELGGINVNAFPKLIINIQQKSNLPDVYTSLYEFLITQNIELLKQINADSAQVVHLYDQLIAFEKGNQGNTAALIQSELDRLNFVYNTTKANRQVANQDYRKALDTLIKTYANDPYIITAIVQKAQTLLSDYNTPESVSNKEVYELCTAAVIRFPNSDQIASVRRILDQITTPYIQAQLPNQLYPERTTSIDFSYRNLGSFRVHIEQLSIDDQALRLSSLIDTSAINNTVSVYDKEVTLPQAAPYLEKTYTIPLALSHEGFYRITVTGPTSDMISSDFFTVSKTASLFRPGPNDKQSQSGEVIAVDWLTGKPLRNAFVKLYNEKTSKGIESLEEKGSVKVDRNGIADFYFDANEINRYRVTDGKSYASFLNPLDRYYGNNNTQTKLRKQVSLLTDRAVYRPGQTVSFKGIVFESDQLTANVIKGTTGELTVSSNNGSKIYTYNYTTDAFGGFSGSFALPADMLNGFVTLSTPESATSIQVQAYKRPNFYIALKPDTSVYQAGDSVFVMGQVLAYNGVTMPNCAISYQVDRVSMARYFIQGQNEANFASGTLQTDAKGNFKIAIKTKKEDGENTGSFFWPKAVWYQFNISATDMAGETQTADTRIAVGKNALNVYTDLAELIDKERIPQTTVTITNANGELIAVNGTINIQQVTSTEQFDRYGELLNNIHNDSTIHVEKAIVATLPFTSGKPVDLSSLADLKSGCYQLSIEAKTTNGLVAQEVRRIMIYNLKDELPPANLKVWMASMNTNVVPGKSTWITFGTYMKDVHLLYEVVANGVCLKRDRVTLSKENQRFVIPYTAEMGNGAVVYFTFVKEGKVYQESVVIKRKQPDKTLSVKFETFTDKTVPGAELTYTLRVQNPDSTAADAALLAGMYDAALDVFATNNWSIDPLQSIQIYPSVLNTGVMFNNQYLQAYASLPEYRNYIAAKWVFDWKNYFTPNMLGLYRYRAMPMLTAGFAKSSNSMVEEEAAIASDMTPAPAPKPTQQNNIRANMLETAFFYPDLKTDQKGEVSFSFKVPEVNTRWKLMLLANTASMNVGTKTDYLVSSKQLMVQPNWPRFVRSGDLVDLSTLVINNTVDNLSGTTTLQVTDEYGNVLKTIDAIGQKFDLKGNTSQVATWQLRVPKGTNFLVFKVIADSKLYSDGEQVMIPVVPDDYVVTSSKQVSLKAGESMELRWSDLLKNADDALNGIATIEVINNPAWTAVEVLPYLQSRDNDNALSLLGSFFAGKTAMQLIDFVPGIKSRLAQLSATTSEMKMQSNLAKGALLTDLNLQSTPWLNESNRELQQRLALKNLLNRNMLTANCKTAMQQLIALQNEDGSISWFKNMPGDLSVTLSVLYGMASLIDLNAVEYGEAEKMMQIKALNYLDNAVKDRYNNIKEKATYTLSNDLLFYLYVRSLYRDIPENGDAREAIRFFTAKAEENWTTHAVADKAMIALLMQANGKKELAQAVAQNLLTIATVNNSLGMYWNNPMYTGTEAFLSPISVHVLAMHALQTILPGEFATKKDLLITWLIRQKEVQQWPTTPATLSAVYGILTSCSFTDKSSRIDISWGDQKYSFSESSNQTGVIRNKMQGNSRTSSINRITVANTGGNIAWINLFYQYNVPVASIEKNNSELSIRKHLFVKRFADNKPELIPLAKAGKLNNGDVIVTKLEISADRTMNYVCIRDWRSGCLEPASSQSGYSFAGSIGYYLDIKDVYTNIFISELPAGKHVIMLESFVSRQGDYLAAPASIESVYAPRFVNYSQGASIRTDQN